MDGLATRHTQQYAAEYTPIVLIVASKGVARSWATGGLHKGGAATYHDPLVSLASRLPARMTMAQMPFIKYSAPFTCLGTFSFVGGF